MKKINSRSRDPEQVKSQAENTNTLGQGITKTLLEKYKPKVIYDTEALSHMEAQKRVA
tara:strand:+ start:112 stop:285 length:174 start_codon:yes stop_codon:yes gene_type:complete